MTRVDMVMGRYHSQGSSNGFTSVKRLSMAKCVAATSLNRFESEGGRTLSKSGSGPVPWKNQI